MPESKRRKPKNPPQSARAAAATKAKDPSPTWYVVLMATLMIVGVILVLLRFIIPGWDQTVLVIGLVLIAAGFLMTTNYR